MTLQLNIYRAGRRTSITLPHLLAELVAVWLSEKPGTPEAITATRQEVQHIVDDADDTVGELSQYVQGVLLLNIVDDGLFNRWEQATG